MEIIVGAIILKDNKILMVKEAKKECFGKWAFPAGHLEENEDIFKGALREVYEETGCKVKLDKIFPIFNLNNNNKRIIMFHFLAKIIEEDKYYKTSEILETKWFTIDELKHIPKEQFRNCHVIEEIIKNIENKKLYDLDLLVEIQNGGKHE